MIVPLEVKIDRVESTVADDLIYVGAESLDIKPPTYRVRAAMLDVERSRVVEYEFHSMIDLNKPIGQEIGVVTHVDVERHRKHLITLRDALNLALARSL